jgi:hypothetical protein
VTTALLLIILILFAALIVDLGRLRVDRSTDQLVADSAVIAATAEVAFSPARDACEVGFIYSLRNLSLSESLVQSKITEATNTCNTAFPSFTCVNPDPAAVPPILGTTSQTAELLVNEYKIVFTHPVHDDDSLMSFQTQVAAKDDGEPCDRVAISVRRASDYILAGVAGYSGSTTTSSAVARSYVAIENDIYASLVVTDRNGCATIHTNGTNAAIRVTTFIDTDDNNKEYPGTITVDSAPGACSNDQRVFDVDGAGARIEVDADGIIFSYGLTFGSPEAAIFDSSDIPSRLSEEPIPGPLVTRWLIDDRYNCGAQGGIGGEEYLPMGTYLTDGGFEQSAEGQRGKQCTESSSPPDPYIEELYDFIHTARNAATPPTTRADIFKAMGFTVYGDDPGENCSAVDLPTATASRWYFDCPSGATVKNGSSVVMDNAELVIFEGGIDINGPGGLMSITGPSDDPATSDNEERDATVVVWSGDVGIQGVIALDRTFLYVNDGRLGKTGGGSLTLNAPLDNAGQSTAFTCPDSTVSVIDTTDDATPSTGIPPAIASLLDVTSWPESSCFEDLTVWQNGYGTAPSDALSLGGNGLLDVEGTVFSPNAKVNVAGGSGSDLKSAQFFGWAFEYSGNGVLDLEPNPDRGTALASYSAQLIR